MRCRTNKKMLLDCLSGWIVPYSCMHVCVRLRPTCLRFLWKRVCHGRFRWPHTNPFNSLGAYATDGGPVLIPVGPAPKTSFCATAAVRTQTKPPFNSSASLFIFRGIRGNTRRGLSDPNSRTSLLFYTQASSQLSLIFSNCFLSCLVE